MAVEWEKAEAAIIVAILEVGEKEGAFYIEDKEKMARTIQLMMFRFSVPTAFLEAEFSPLDVELDDVITLVLDAFSWRSAHPEQSYRVISSTGSASH